VSTLEYLAHQLDVGLAAAGFRLLVGGSIRRKYEGALGGMPATADVSIMLVAPSTPSGYTLTLGVRTPAPARWVAGQRIPLLLRAGLTSVDDPPHGPLLRAHDAEWARRFVEHAPSREALRAVLAEATFVEHRPGGELEVQVQRLASVVVPDVPRLAHAVGVVAATAAAPPLPAPAPARWSDDRTLVMAVITIGVLGFCALLTVIVVVAFMT
jgi:hypothetical protein